MFANREDIRISRPCKMAELRMRDLDDAVSGWDVSHSIAEAGGCRPSEVATGTIRKDPNGLGTVWVRCPLVAANRIAEVGKILVGWAVARVQLLDARPLQCFRCLEGGHVKATCNGVEAPDVISAGTLATRPKTVRLDLAALCVRIWGARPVTEPAAGPALLRIEKVGGMGAIRLDHQLGLTSPRVPLG